MPVVNPHVHSEQEILNSSFDETFGVVVTEPVRRNSGATALEYFNPATEEKQDTIITALGGVTGIGHGVKTVTTAGTDVALAASTPCKKVDIQAQTDNTSAIAVGGSGVDATVATGTGIFLNPGDVYSLEIDNLADIYIDSLVSGEGVRFTYYS